MALSGDRSHPADQVKVRSQRHALDFERFDAITFDCYGTLIDWEAGILAALDPLLDPHGVVGRSDEELLERFARLESEAERGPFQRYRSILARVARGFGGEFGFEATSAQVEAFAASVVAWPPFADAPPALAALGARYRLAIVSNVDDDLFAGSARQLGVDFSEDALRVSSGFKPKSYFIFSFISESIKFFFDHVL